MNQTIMIKNVDQEAGVTQGSSRPVRLLSEEGGLRLVLDQSPDDPVGAGLHDLLLERNRGEWHVYFHPNEGDPLLRLEIAPQRVRLFVSDGDTARHEWDVDDPLDRGADVGVLLEGAAKLGDQHADDSERDALVDLCRELWDNLDDKARAKFRHSTTYQILAAAAGRAGG